LNAIHEQKDAWSFRQAASQKEAPDYYQKRAYAATKYKKRSLTAYTQKVMFKNEDIYEEDDYVGEWT
jgi:hypothetical protein